MNSIFNVLRCFLLRTTLVCVFLSLLSITEVTAATWTDPNFDQTIQLSKFVGVVENTGQNGPNGAHTLMFKVVETWKSKVKPGVFIEVTGHYDREAQDAPDIPDKQRFVAFLDFRQRVWTALTPSIGLLPIKDQDVLGITRDTSLRFPLKLSRYRRFTCSMIAGKPDKGLLEQSRLVLRKMGKFALSKAQIFRAIEALEYLARFAEPSDFKLLKSFHSIKFYQVRASAARALGAIQTKESVSLLLQMTSDGQPLVSGWAGFTLLDTKKIPTELESIVIKQARAANSEDLALHESVTDPRRNRLPACKTSLLRLIGRQKMKSGLEILNAHLTHDEIEVVKAALWSLVQFEDKTLITSIVEAMPEDPARVTFYNRYFVSALEQLSGVRAGKTKAAWKKWLSKHPQGQ